MTKDIEERAREVLREMNDLIETCERQLAEGRELLASAGMDDAKIDALIAGLPESERRKVDEAIARDVQAIKEEAERARPVIPARTGGKAKMRPMV